MLIILPYRCLISCTCVYVGGKQDLYFSSRFNSFRFVSFQFVSISLSCPVHASMPNVRKYVGKCFFVLVARSAFGLPRASKHVKVSPTKGSPCALRINVGGFLERRRRAVIDDWSPMWRVSRSPALRITCDAPIHICVELAVSIITYYLDVCTEF